MRTLALVAFLAASAIVVLTPSPAVAAPPGTSCSSAGCFADATGDQRVNGSAATESLEVEFCATVLTGRPLSAAQQLAGSKSLYVENRSSATCYLSLDAETLTSTGSTGYKFAAGTERSFDIDGSIFGPLIRFVCTATQTTGSCLFLGWLK